jgi:hypothetical protein
MLAELEIENLAVIAHARIPFSPHLNVFTGETGAGKSILLHGIHAVLGQRVTRDIVRTGCKKAVVTALFTHLDPLVCARLDALSISHTDDELLLTREIAADGGSAARVNGHTTTVSVLREIGDALINIHGQHDNQVLLAPECHLQILDAFGGDDTLLHQYQDTFRQLQQTAKRLNHLAKQEQDKAHRRQQLKALVAEVDELGLEQGEEEALEEELNLLQHAESIAAALQAAAEAIDGEDADGSAVLLTEAAAEELSPFSDMRAEFAVRRAQERLPRESGARDYVDEDRFWLWGLFYCNPDDRRALVSDRTGMGMGMNLAKPAGKITMGLVALILVIGVPLAALWLIAMDYTPREARIEDGVLYFEHFTEKYEIALDEISGTELLDSLPSAKRVAGTGMDTLCEGRFDVEGYENVRISLDPGQDCFIVVLTEGGLTRIFNLMTRGETEGFYAELTAAR